MNISTPNHLTVPFATYTSTSKNIRSSMPYPPSSEFNAASQQQRNGLKQNKTFRNVMLGASVASSFIYMGLYLYIVGQVGQIRKSLEKISLQQNKTTPSTPKTHPAKNA